MNLIGSKVILKPMTLSLCNEVYRNYVPDPIMTDKPFSYTEEWVNQYFTSRDGDPARRFFAVTVAGRAIGEIQVKYLNFIVKKGNIGITLINDSVKGKGYGTEAERRIIQYAFQKLKLNVLYADAVLRNTRSQHIMEKLGFRYVHKDDIFRYYELQRENYKG